MRAQNIVIAGAAAVAMAAGAPAAAFATISAGDGTIHGCYDSGGNLKVIDTSVTSSCPKGTRG